MSIRERIPPLHAWYCRNVMPLRLTPEVERLWFDWLKAGYNGTDLRDVIRYIRRQISAGKRNEGALKLTNLIQRSEAGFIGFDQDLGLARARANLNVDKKLEPAPDAKAPGVAPNGNAESGSQPPFTTPGAAPDINESIRKLKEAAR